MLEEQCEGKMDRELSSRATISSKAGNAGIEIAPAGEHCS